MVVQDMIEGEPIHKYASANMCNKCGQEACQEDQGETKPYKVQALKGLIQGLYKDFKRLVKPIRAL